MEYPFSVLSISLILLLAFVLYLSATAIYNLYLHPLVKFPGPKLAAITRFYELYYELYLGGQFSQHLLELHEKYGPIVRVNSFEVHILDSGFYHNLFNFDTELDKRVYQMENLQNSATFDLHRMRRRAFDPFFSRASILKLEPFIKDMVEKLCTRMSEAKAVGTPVNLSLWYRCLTCDIITDYCLSQSYGLMEDPVKHEPFLRSFCSIFKVLLPIREFAWVAWIAHSMENIPDWMQMGPSDEGMAYMKLWQNGLEPRMRAIVTGDMKRNDEFPHVVMMEEYMKNENLGPEEKTYDRLRQTVQMFVAAGLETVGFALSMATYHMPSDPSVLQRLRSEVASIWPKDGSLPDWSTLEKLPYLTAVLKESMRLSVGVTARLHRINHRKPIQYKEWQIPAGTSISMNQWFVLWDPEIFPEPKKFMPERWLVGEKSKELDKWFVPFSKGARGCIGEKLAWAEMYLTLAAVVHRFDFELYETDRSHVMPEYDYFVPFPKREDGIRVMIK